MTSFRLIYDDFLFYGCFLCNSNINSLKNFEIPDQVHSFKVCSGYRSKTGVFVSNLAWGTFIYIYAFSLAVFSGVG